MTQEHDSEIISLQRDEYIVNLLAMGIALQILADTSDVSLEDWSQHISERATEQYEQLSREQIEQMIAVYEAVRKS